MSLKEVVLATLEKLGKDYVDSFNKETMEDYLKTLEMARKLDPVETTKIFESTKPVWFDTLQNPQVAAEENPEKFITSLKNYPDLMNETTLEIWYDLNARGLLEHIQDNMGTTSGPLIETWAKHWPENFLQNCEQVQRVALKYWYEPWKKLDPKSHMAALNSTRPYYIEHLVDDTKLMLRWLEDSPETFTNFLLRSPVTFGTITLTETKVFEKWAEVNPEAFKELTEMYPNDMQYNHGTLWAKLDKEGYLKACEDYPLQAIRNPETLKAADEQVFRKLVEKTLQVNMSVPMESSGRKPHEVACLLLYDWETYENTVTVGEAFKFIHARENWEKSQPAKLPKILTANQIAGLNSSQLAELLEYIKENSPEHYAVACLLSTQFTLGGGLRHLRTQEEQDNWMATNATSWLANGSLEALNGLAEFSTEDYGRRDRTLNTILANALNLIEHYRVNRETFKNTLLENELDNMEILLDLVPLVFNETEERQLVQGILETPGQSMEAITWAAMRAGNLTKPEMTQVPVRLNGRKTSQINKNSTLGRD